MTKTSQSELADRLHASQDPAERLEAALALLAATRKREFVDRALRALARDDVRVLLGYEHRAVLREKALAYFEDEKKDSGGRNREQIVRLLVAIGHPGDEDIYRMGVLTYDGPPALDSAQNLRAASLVGLVKLDDELGLAYATKLLGEPATTQGNCEPSMTAVNLLVWGGQALPVYQFVLLVGETFVREAKGEVVGRALELLVAEVPPDLYAALCAPFAAMDAPVAVSGVIAAITQHHAIDLYPLLERIVTGTRHDDLHHYAVIAMATARDDALTAMLYRLAKTCPRDRIASFVEAVSLTDGADREAVLAMLEKRQVGRTDAREP